MNRLIIVLLLSFNANADYNRKEWRHWIDADKDCLNTREEVLVSRSLKPVSFVGLKTCAIEEGRWVDYYTNDILIDPKKIDIDHVVPLKHADDLVGSKWNKKQKEVFANDPDNLIITDRKFNRQKGSKSITEWLPMNRKLACEYTKKWISVKKKYDLPLSNEEKYSNFLACK